MTASNGDRLYLIDGSGFIFRAFHALPPLNRADGTPVNAVLGFTNMLLRLREDLGASRLAVVFDAGRISFRNQIYPAYKANRPETPPELVPQFPLIREAVAALAVPAVELEGYEADDLIASYVRAARAAGQPVTIVSSDKDLMQLVGDGVAMFDPLKNRTIGPAEVFEKFGVAPERVVDVQALAGDSVDNVPGVPGIGVKTAAQLITEYGNLETLLARASAIKQPKRRQSLLDHAEAARVSLRLVTLCDQAPLPLPLTALVGGRPDRATLTGFLRTQGFRALLTRIGQAPTAVTDSPVTDLPAPASPATAPNGETPATAPPSPEAPEAPPPPATSPASDSSDTHPVPPVTAVTPTTLSYELVQTTEALERWIARITEAGVVAVDTETDSLTPCTCKLVGVSLAVAPGQACYIPLGHVDPDGAGATTAGTQGGLAFEPVRPPPVQPGLAEVLALLRPMLEDPSVLKIGHNLKFDLQVFGQHGVAVAPIDDTMLISYVLDGGRHGHGMDELAGLHLGVQTVTFAEVAGSGKAQVTFDRVPLDRACHYAAEDADITLRLHSYLKPRLLAARLNAFYETIERPLVPVVARMERNGIRIDAGVLAGLSREFSQRLGTLETEVHRLAGHAFNVGSPKQLGEVLFGELGLEGGRKGKNGAYSTDGAVLERLAEEGVEIAARVLDWRQLAKLKSTYTDALPEQIDRRTGRIHSSFALAHTNTGRLSSSDPNLQNIPIRSEEGRKIRTAFVTDPGWTLISVDYSQIELRLVAEIAGIGALRQAFRDGQDIHALTASQVFGVPLAEMTPELRRQAKAINFGIIYGISGFGLAQQLGITPGAANAFIRDYLERFHELKAWMESTKAFCRANGYVLTALGRRCPIRGLDDRMQARRAFAERQAINAPIQGTAADIMRRAMVRVDSALAASGLQARMLLQVHDELVLEAPEAEAAATAALVKAAMEGAAALGVPLIAEAGFGDSWAAAH